MKNFLGQYIALVLSNSSKVSHSFCWVKKQAFAGFQLTVFIRLQAEQFFHKTLPKSRKFELEKGPRLIAECFSKQNFSETANSWET